MWGSGYGLWVRVESNANSKHASLFRINRNSCFESALYKFCSERAVLESVATDGRFWSQRTQKEQKLAAWQYWAAIMDDRINTPDRKNKPAP
jgi:hypothetical protein